MSKITFSDTQCACNAAIATTCVSIFRSPNTVVLFLFILVVLARIIHFVPDAESPPSDGTAAARAAQIDSSGAPENTVKPDGDGEFTRNPRYSASAPSADASRNDSSRSSAQEDENDAVLPMSGREMIERENNTMSEFHRGHGQLSHIPSGAMSRLVDAVHHDFERFNRKKDVFLRSCDDDSVSLA